MAWTTPRTWVAGETVTAALLNQQIRDNEAAIFPIGGTFASWAVAVRQSSTPAQTVNYARYFKIGRLVYAAWSVTINGAGVANNSIIVDNLPVAAAVASGIHGSFKYFDAGNTVRAGHVWGASTTSLAFNYTSFGNNMGIGDFAMAAGDVIEGFVMYEGAS